jgi:hypothetical protein
MIEILEKRAIWRATMSALPMNKNAQAGNSDSRGARGSSATVYQEMNKISESLLAQVKAMVKEIQELVSKVEDRVEGVEGLVKGIQISIEELKSKKGNGLEDVEGDEGGDGVTLISLGKRKRAAVSKDGLIVIKEIENGDSNLRARLRECLRKFCLSPAGVFYFQGFKVHFIGRILCAIF